VDVADVKPNEYEYELSTMIAFEELLAFQLQSTSMEAIDESSANEHFNRSIIHTISVQYVEQLLARLPERNLPIIEYEPTEVLFESVDAIATVDSSHISFGFYNGLDTATSTFRANLDPIAESDVASMQSTLSSGISAIEQSSLDDADNKDSKSTLIINDVSSIHSTLTLPKAIFVLEDSINSEIIMQENNNIQRMSSYLLPSTPYKVTKLLSADRKRMEVKEFIPPQNVWTPGVGTGKGTQSRSMAPSAYSFESANRLLQKLRDMSHQVFEC
jgi:hypothetical protein